jgi:hypothetical protein
MFMSVLLVKETEIMKAIAIQILMVLAIIPLSAQASIPSDMANSDYTLVQVVQNAAGSGKAMGTIVSEMIKADRTQSSASIATALVVSPADYNSIIEASIAEGIACSDVVAIALIATDEAMSKEVVEAVIRACPNNQEKELRLVAVRVAKFESGTAVGGAGNTAEEFRELQDAEDAAATALDEIAKQQLLVDQARDDVEEAKNAYDAAVDEFGPESDQAIAAQNILNTSLENYNRELTAMSQLTKPCDPSASPAGEGCTT